MFVAFGCWEGYGKQASHAEQPLYYSLKGGSSRRLRPGTGKISASGSNVYAANICSMIVSVSSKANDVHSNLNLLVFSSEAEPGAIVDK